MSKQKLKTISGKLKKASKAHAGQAKQIDGVISAMPMKMQVLEIIFISGKEDIQTP